MYGPAAGAATGALLGLYKRENPGDPTQGLNMALRGGLAGIGSNIAGGKTGLDTIFGGGISDKYTLGDIFGKEGFANIKDYLNVGDDKKSFARQYLEGFFEDKPIEQSLLKETAETLNIDTEDKAKMKFLEKLIKDKQKGKFGNLSLGKLASLYGLGTAGLGFLIDKTSSDGPVGLPADTMPEGNVLTNIVNPIKVNPDASNAIVNYGKKDGGIMDLQDGGESVGPGTGTSDSIPAMLSDGEFVMTAKAVRGAGGGDRREGARKMYEAMDNLEARA
jgi:hypothetical protein